jgi:tRNA wybutosine-synthesizing protein 1
MDDAYKELLKKQGYEFCGEHSAVKTCEWTKKSLREEGFCYKQKFYGINSHRCCQMSPAVNFCTNDCIFCWRERNNSPFGKIDDPKDIVEKAIKVQAHLLVGFKGYDKVDKKKIEEGLNPIHFAISLSGEPMAYPKINELIKELNKRKISSFLVTNGQFPEKLEKIDKTEMPTQLYISLDAPNKEVYDKTCMPDAKDAWKKLMKSLEVMKKIKGHTRTALRLTLVKGLNMLNPEQYAELIERANPDFVEAKAYMFVGASRLKLLMSNMPRHPEIVAFAKEIEKRCSYKIIDEHKISRVVLMMKKDFPGRIMKFS